VASIKDIADRSYISGKPIGILSGDERDTWAKNHSLLLGFLTHFCFLIIVKLLLCMNIFSGLGNNRDIIKDIETSLFILCLDKTMPADAFREQNNASVRAVQTMTGFNSYLNAGNRWHDKTVQVKYPTETSLLL